MTSGELASPSLMQRSLSSSSSSFSYLPSPHVSSGVADPHFPATAPVSELDSALSPAHLEEERIANEKERKKLSRRRRRQRLMLAPSSSSFLSSLSTSLSLHHPLKSLHSKPLAELENAASRDARSRGGRRPASTPRGRSARWADVRESNEMDTLPSCHSSLLYLLTPQTLQRVLEHFVFSVVVLLLTLLLGLLLILRIADDERDVPLQDAAICILVFFAVEMIMRLLAYGVRAFLLHPFFLLSSALTLLSFLFILNAFSISRLVNNVVALVLQCLHMLLRFTSITLTLTSSARRMVSTNKTRYTQHGFDLDLSYITPRVIAMGLPSQHLEGLYRNPIEQVQRFFLSMHPQHFLIVNLCSERRYDSQLFDRRVLCFPFDDHNPPPLSTIVEFCTTVDRFLQEDERNVVAVHCKGGKGRTGTMIACWLLYSSLSAQDDGSGSSLFAEDAMKLFARCRTERGVAGKVQGVSGPSQKRYVQYFEQLQWRMRREEEEADKREEERRRRLDKKRRQLGADNIAACIQEESKEFDSGTVAELPAEEAKERPPATVSPVSAASSSRPAPTRAITPPAVSRLAEEKENDESIRQPFSSDSSKPLSASSDSSAPIAADSSSSSSAPSYPGRKSSHHRRSEFLSYASSLLYHSPKCELVSLVLNNAVLKEKDALQLGDARSRDEWNETWNHRDNWSLVITHYRPILPQPQHDDDDDDAQLTAAAAEKEREEEKRSSESDQARAAHPSARDIHIDINAGGSAPAFSSASARLPPPRRVRPRLSSSLLSELNAYNERRYADVHEYYFRARKRQEGDDDTSVTFDISSFHENSRSLILSGDLKFQIYRGKFDVGEDDDEQQSGAGGAAGGRGRAEGREERRGREEGEGGSGSSAPQRKLSRALAHPLTLQTPRLFAWFWVHTCFLQPTAAFAPSPSPSASASSSTLPPAPSELILRKNQLDEAFQASDIDSEFNVYLYFLSPPVHQQAAQIQELHTGQILRIKQMEEKRIAKEREDRRRKEGGGAAAAMGYKAEAGGKKTKAAELELAEVGQGGQRASGAGGSDGGISERFGELKEDSDDDRTGTGAEAEARSSSTERSKGVSSHGRGHRKEEEAEEEEDDDDGGSTDEEEEEAAEVEDEEAEVEAEEAQADFAA